MREANGCDGDGDKCTHIKLFHILPNDGTANPSNGTDVNTCSDHVYVLFFFFVVVVFRLRYNVSFGLPINFTSRVCVCVEFRGECKTRFKWQKFDARFKKHRKCDAFDDPFQKEGIECQIGRLFAFTIEIIAQTLLTWWTWTLNNTHTHTSYFIDSIWSIPNNAIFPCRLTNLNKIWFFE